MIETSTGETSTPADIDPKLLEILVCPVTKGPLEYDRAAQELVSRKAGLAYPVRDGIPIMLLDEATPGPAGVGVEVDSSSAGPTNGAAGG